MVTPNDDALLERLRGLQPAVRRLDCGATVASGGPLDPAVGAVARHGFAFAVVDLFGEGDDPAGADVAVSDRELPPQVWGQRIVGRARIPARDPHEALRRQLSWARYVSLAAVTCPLPPGADPIAVARAIRAQLSEDGVPIWLEVPWADGYAPWQAIRTLCDAHPGLFACLRADGPTPDADRVAAWRAEAVACLAVPASRASEPGAREALTGLFSGMTKRAYVDAPSPAPAAMKALSEAFEAAWAGVDDPARFDVDFHDRLLDPVQPLRDHIPSATYAHFEQAAVKYGAYTDAMRGVLADRARDDDAPIPVLVAGAGRGPLVQATLHASDETGVPVKVHALEKNPNAAMTLRRRNAEDWGGAVAVHEADMRRWVPPEPFEVLVSELLGGFGDNELSVECLDAVQGCLQEGGISVPESSTSFLAPVAAPALHGAARRQPGGLERPHGVHLTRARLLAADQPCFTFEHPSPDPGPRDRFVRLSFEVEAAGELSGFIGRFDARLHRSVTITIRGGAGVAVNEAWAPVWFPLRTPVWVEAGEQVELGLWRCVDQRAVWYEWALTAPTTSAIHNPGGRHHAMAL